MFTKCNENLAKVLKLKTNKSSLFQYEFKASGVKKRKVTMDVSIEGVRVTTRKKMVKSKVRNKKLFKNIFYFIALWNVLFI